MFVLSVNIFFNLKCVATSVVVKYMAIALTNLVIVSVGKDEKVFSQTLHGKTFLNLFRCTCVFHQILAAVKPQVTVLAEKMSSSTVLLLSSNSTDSPTTMPSTPTGPVASK